MTWRLVYHPHAARFDILKIPVDTRQRIERAIESRLAPEPERYGKPLRGTLRCYWKLRVGDYRVVYELIGDEGPHSGRSSQAGSVSGSSSGEPELGHETHFITGLVQLAVADSYRGVKADCN